MGLYCTWIASLRVRNIKAARVEYEVQVCMDTATINRVASRQLVPSFLRSRWGDISTLSIALRRVVGVLKLGVHGTHFNDVRYCSRQSNEGLSRRTFVRYE